MGIVLIVYAIIILIGGVAGFRLAGSRASLIMGSITGLMLAVSGTLVLFGNKGCLLRPGGKHGADSGFWFALSANYENGAGGVNAGGIGDCRSHTLCAAVYLNR